LNVGKWGPSDPREERRRRAERSRRYDTRERLGARQSCHHTPAGQYAWVAEALPEEPHAFIAHVRVCGGAGWVTIGSTRQRTASSVRSCLAPLPAAAQAWRCYDFQCQELGATFFRSSYIFCPRCIGRGGASKRRRLILLLSVGWLPPYLHPSGACLTLGSSMP